MIYDSLDFSQFLESFMKRENSNLDIQEILSREYSKMKYIVAFMSEEGPAQNAFKIYRSLKMRYLSRLRKSSDKDKPTKMKEHKYPLIPNRQLCSAVISIVRIADRSSIRTAIQIHTKQRTEKYITPEDDTVMRVPVRLCTETVVTGRQCILQQR